ncbi:hypothetical protein AK812_SmicGene21137 [Symbiodinium microadriaticum]|uniref:Uncharacterized protein n=1 Tax=Symbiodinium microadriaticum TaxID=2951 RepID=A0A1Q9DN69_SYMMI|nr:hypothetical protein AK812_SmicGene21137 [Symbiodinium microadriaticum]
MLLCFWPLSKSEDPSFQVALDLTAQALLLSERLEHEVTLAPLAVKAFRGLALLLLEEPSLVPEATKEDENEADEEQEEVEEEKVAEVPTAELDGKVCPREEAQAPATLPEEATPMSVEKEAAPVDEPKEEDQKDSAPEPTKASIPLEEEEPAPKDEALEEID